MDAGKIAQLKAFVHLCESTPSVLQDPSLRFFRNYLEKLNAKLPPSAYGKSETSKEHKEESDEEMPEFNEKSRGTANQQESAGAFESDTSDIEESDVDLDTSEVVEPDDEPPQPMGDASIDVTEEMRDNAQIAKGKAVEAIEEGDLETAIRCFTEAILGNPSSSILYANRAGVYVKMKKPNAAIRDADAAIKINPDSARGYKSRGQAHALLGHWAEAAKDLHIASNLDYDEEIASILKKVEPNAHKIEEHERKYQRLRKEREVRKAARSKARQQQSEAKKKSEPSASQGGMPGGGFPGGFPSGGFPGGMPGGMPGGGFPGGMPGGMPGGIDISKILSDPEMLSAFQDPEVMAALQDIMKNPANLVKHQGNPKVAPLIAKMMGKFAGGQSG